MLIYSSNHPGVILDDITLTNLGIQRAQLRGYFSKDDMNSLLERNSDCVGIRVYNIRPLSDTSRLIAVCVQENGADMRENGTHILSDTSDSASNRSREINRMTASTFVVGDDSNMNKSERFSSFFSREMILNLQNESTHSGFAFYKTIWLGGRSTHLVVTSDLSEDDGSIIGIEGTGFNNSLSDQPCPGHCAKLDENGVEVISPEPMKSDPNDLDAHYIPVWQ